MKKRLSLVLCLALIICMIPTTSAMAAKKVKSKSVSVAPKAMTLAVGDIAQLTAKMKPSNTTDKISWSTSDKAVATVTGKGVVQGVAEGTAKITAKTTSKKTASCVVSVKKYASEEALREAIKEDLKAIFATKEDVLASIKQNTYTKSEIDSKISAASGGGSTVVNNCDCGKDFIDGDSLQLIDAQSLPITLESSYKDGKETKNTKLTITSVSIKKYHYNEFRNSIYNPVKYTLEIKGIFDTVAAYGNDITITFLNKDQTSYDDRSYDLMTIKNDGNTDSTYDTDGNNFTLTVDQFNMPANFSKFFIRSMNSWAYEGE